MIFHKKYLLVNIISTRAYLIWKVKRNIIRSYIYSALTTWFKAWLLAYEFAWLQTHIFTHVCLFFKGDTVSSLLTKFYFLVERCWLTNLTRGLGKDDKMDWGRYEGKNGLSDVAELLWKHEIRVRYSKEYKTGIIYLMNSNFGIKVINKLTCLELLMLIYLNRFGKLPLPT